MSHPILTRDNPRLLQLQQEYDSLHLDFRHTAWKDHQNNLGIDNFRYDGAYLGLGALWDDAYRNMFDHVVSIDRNDYLHCLQEDSDFGMITYDFPMPDGQMKTVSRDLLDSIMEIYFVQEALKGIDDIYHFHGIPMRWLDIGAGYGRLAYRLNTLNPSTTYVTCVDAVAVSTFLCEFYTQYRQCTDNVEVLPLSRLHDIEPGEFDIACNIHSWSECSDRAINFWLDKLIAWKVPYLFVVPHDLRWVCVNEDGSIGNFKPLIEAHGYEEIYSRPKYPDGVNGLYPEVNYFMFRRSF